MVLAGILVQSLSSSLVGFDLFIIELYCVVAPLSFLRSISLASLFTSLSIFG